MDFGQPEQARGLINAWVEERTAKRIPELLPVGAITPSTRLVLTNAIRFKASWLFPFDAAQTDAAEFAAPSGTRNVQMMHDARIRQYAQGADYQAVELPYLSADVRMLLVSPNEG